MTFQNTKDLTENEVYFITKSLVPNIRVTTLLIERTLTETTTETICQCRKVCKNFKGLKIIQARFNWIQKSNKIKQGTSQTLIRRQRTTARKNTTLMRTSYLIKLLRSILREGQRIQNQQRTVPIVNRQGKKRYNDHQQMIGDVRSLRKIQKDLIQHTDWRCTQEDINIVNNRVHSWTKNVWSE